MRLLARAAVAAAGIAALGASSLALAGTPGRASYEGFTDQGRPISLRVKDDARGVRYEIGYRMDCIGADPAESTAFSTRGDRIRPDAEGRFHVAFEQDDEFGDGIPYHLTSDLHGRVGKRRARGTYQGTLTFTSPLTGQLVSCDSGPWPGALRAADARPRLKRGPSGHAERIDVGRHSRRFALFATVALAAISLALAPAGGVAKRDIETAGQRPTTLVSKASGKRMPDRWQQWARRSLVPLVEGRVKVSLGGCPASRRAVGCVYSTRLRTVYLDRGRAVMPATLYHEAGHLFDYRVMNNRDRRAFKRIVHKRRQGWFKGREEPAEQFAEAYSFCARYRRIRSIERYTTYGYDPSPKEHRRACRLIVAAAQPESPPPQPPPNPPPVTSDPEQPPEQPPDDPDHEPGAPLPELPPTPGPPFPPLPIG